MNFQKIKYQTYLLSIFLFFLIHQIFYLTKGGNTYDELFLIYESGNIFNKIRLFFTDNNNPLLYDIGVNEYYGFLVILPIYILANSNTVNNLLDIFYTNLEIQQPDEILYFNMHILLNIYVVVILFFIYRKLLNFYSKNTSLLVVIFITLFPSFNGQSLFNIKDIPYALQLFLGVIYLYSYLYNLYIGQNTNKKEILFTGINIGLACLLRVNAYGFIGLVSFYFLILAIYKKSDLGQYLKMNLYVYFISLLVVIIGSPSSWKSPFKWFYDALIHQFFYEWSGYTLTNGRFIEASNVSSTYLIEWFFYRSPIVYILGFIFYVLLFLKKKTNNHFSRFALFFLLFVNLLFILLKPNAYDGIRQFLFLLPYISLIFVESINELFSKKSVRIIYLLASLLYVIYSQYTLGPYKYVYLNEFSDEINISEYCEKIDGCGDWPTDYYAFSGRELAKKINNSNIQTLLSCKPPQAVNTYLKPNINVSRSVQELKDAEVTTFYTSSFHRPRPFNDSCRFDINNVIYDCKMIDKVVTKLRSKEIALSYISKCEVNY